MMNNVKNLVGTDSGKKVFSLFGEFKTFAFKGNVIDLAVGVVIGAAFAKIIDSLVKNIIMPLIGMLPLGDKGYESWYIPLLGGSKMPIGLFLGDVISFLLVALALFIFVVKFLGWMMKSKKAEVITPPPPTKDQELLMEIRDLLKAQVKT